MCTNNESQKQVKWEELFRPLYSLTHKLLKCKKWFRGENTDTYIAGRQVDDYVYEAIKIYLEKPERHKPEKGILLKYLINVIYSLIGKDCRSGENKKTLYVKPETEEEDDKEDDIQTISKSKTPRFEAYFDEQIDFDLIMLEIEKEIKGDDLLEKLFLGICCFDMPRRDVCKEFKITEKEYDNGVRRLNTIINKVVKKFKIINKLRL